MAPQKYENFLLLIKILQINGISAEEVFSAVRKLRNLSRAIGRAINNIIIKKNSDNLDAKLLTLIDSAGVDLEELMNAVEAREIIRVSQKAINISPANTGKIFKIDLSSPAPSSVSGRA